MTIILKTGTLRLKKVFTMLTTRVFALTKVFAVYFLSAWAYTPAMSQSLSLIPHHTGAALIGNTIVTVSHPGSATSITPSCGGTGHYLMGTLNADSEFIYRFIPATDHVRFAFQNFENGEIISFYINGQLYNISTANVSAHPGTCGCPLFATVTNGKLTSTTTSINNCSQVDIYFPGIDSVKVDHNNEGAGVRFSSYFQEDTTTFIKQPFTDTVLCAGQKFPLIYSTSFRFNSNNIFTAQLSNASGSFASPVNIGSHADTTGDTIWCTIPPNTGAGNGYRVRIVSSNPADTSLDNQVNIRVKAAPNNFSNSATTPVCTGDTVKLFGNTSSNGITWAWTGPGSFTSAAEDSFIANSAMSHAGDYMLTATLNSTGCSLKDTTTVVMKQTPVKPVANSNSPVCETKTLTLSTSSSTSGVSYGWAGPGSYSSTSQNPTVTSNAAGTHAGDYISTATLNGCSSKDTVTVIVLPKPTKPTAGAVNPSLCAKQDLQLTASTVTGANYTWLGPSSFTANT